MSTDLNGFWIQLLNQNQQNLFSYHDYYGVATGQFSRLAGLYEQYRLLGVSLEWVRGQTNNVYTQAPMLGWHDPSGEMSNYPTSIEEWARSPSPHIASDGNLRM